MPHKKSRKKHASNERGSEPESASEKRRQVCELAPEYTKPDKQRNEPHTPLYDDPNHVAYGWQQMTTVPDTQNLVWRTENDPPLSHWSRPQTWPTEQSGDSKGASSGFNPHPGRIQGPRRPRPFTECAGVTQHAHDDRRQFEPFFEPAVAQQDVNNDDRSLAASVALISKDANQKLLIDREQAPPVTRLAESHRERSELWSKGLIANKLEKPVLADNRARRLKRPAQPTLLGIRRKPVNKFDAGAGSRPSTLEQACMLRAEQGKAGSAETSVNVGGDKSTSGKPDVAQAASSDDRKIESVSDLIAAVNEKLYGLTVQPRSHFEHRSAVPKPLDLAKIETE